MNQPYKSPYYDKLLFYERFGQIVLPIGVEQFYWIEDRAVDGIEYHRYSISNYLRVFDYKSNRLLPYTYTNYVSVTLNNVKTGRKSAYNLHRIYMCTFCPVEGMEFLDVNHIDGNKYNFHPSNLEWSTKRSNAKHAIKYGLAKRKIDDDGVIDIYESFNNNTATKAELAEKYGVSRTLISDIVKSRNKYYYALSNIYEVENRIVPETISIDDGIRTMLPEIVQKYNEGAEYYQLAEEYNYDRSGITKAIKKYVKDHPECGVTLRNRNVYDKSQAKIICEMLDELLPIYGKDHTKIFNIIIERNNWPNTTATRKAISHILNGKTHVDVAANYNFSKSSTTIEKVT